MSSRQGRTEALLPFFHQNGHVTMESGLITTLKVIASLPCHAQAFSGNSMTTGSWHLDKSIFTGDVFELEFPEPRSKGPRLPSSELRACFIPYAFFPQKPEFRTCSEVAF